MERWPSGSAAAASEVTTVSTAANVPSTFHAGASTTLTIKTTPATTTTTTTTPAAITTSRSTGHYGFNLSENMPFTRFNNNNKNQ